MAISSPEPTVCLACPKFIAFLPLAEVWWRSPLTIIILFQNTMGISE